MKRFLAIALIVLAVGSSVSFAQDGVKPMILINGGISIPVGPEIFREYWGFGFGGGAGIGILVPDNPYMGNAWVDVQYTRVMGEDKGFIQAEDLNVLTVMLKSKLNFVKEGKVVPYLPAGVGLFRLSGGDESENAFGGEIGFGVAVNINENTHFYVETAWTYGLTEGDPTSLVPVRAGAIIIP